MSIKRQLLIEDFLKVEKDKLLADCKNVQRLSREVDRYLNVYLASGTKKSHAETAKRIRELINTLKSMKADMTSISNEVNQLLERFKDSDT